MGTKINARSVRSGTESDAYPYVTLRARSMFDRVRGKSIRAPLAVRIDPRDMYQCPTNSLKLPTMYTSRASQIAKVQIIFIIETAGM